MATDHTMETICADLAAEHEALDVIVRRLDDDGWDTPTPAEGWRVRDQIGHLTFFDGQGSLAVRDPAAFEAGRDAGFADPDAFGRAAMAIGRELTGDALTRAWRRARADVLADFAVLDPKVRVPWYGPPMSAMSFVTARLMETWAHGQDVADALGAERPATDRLKHVAHIGVRARPWSYVVRELAVPDFEVYVELVPPGGGDAWTWGDAVAAGGNRVLATALDFCLVVTQRRHRADTGLVAEGPLADEWMSIAQAFAGGVGAGRQPGQFPRRYGPEGVTAPD